MRIGVTLFTALLLAAFAPGDSFGGASDIDGDGTPDDADTCPLTFNPGCNPLVAGCDTTEVGAGKAADGIPDACDNCLTETNADQCDSNLDGYGNACDQDLDDSGMVDAGDVVNKMGTGFNQNFGTAGALCDPTAHPGGQAAATILDADFDYSGAVDAGDVVNKMGTGFNQNFGKVMGGLSGLACAGSPGLCPPETGPHAP